MTERVFAFGPRSAIVGVLATPEPGKQVAGAPAVLMWNVGVNHRVGPYRAFVDLSRELAAVGYTALRFDVSGLGDSQARRDAANDSESADLDLRDAMDAISRRTGITRFVVLGFCSSVDAAHRIAVKDERVVGTIHLEGYAYRTPEFHLRVALRALSRQRWKRRALMGVDSVRASLGQEVPPPSPPEPIYKRDYPTWDAYSRDLAALSRRGVAMLFVYVGIDTDYNYERQFWDMFGTPELDRGQVEVQYYPHADHVFLGVRSRRKMFARVLSFMCTRFPAT